MISVLKKDNAYIAVFEDLDPKEKELFNQINIYVESQKESPYKQMDINDCINAQKKAIESLDEQIQAASGPEEPEPVKTTVFHYRRNNKVAAQGEQKKQPAKEQVKASEEKKPEEDPLTRSSFVRRKPSGFAYRRDEKELAAEIEKDTAKKTEGAMKVPEKQKEQLPASPVSEDKAPALQVTGNNEPKDAPDTKEPEQPVKKRKTLNGRGLNFVGNSSDARQSISDAKAEKLLDEIYKFMSNNYLDCPFLSKKEKEQIARERFHYSIKDKAFDKDFDFKTFPLEEMKNELALQSEPEMEMDER